jgi:hypothetical protein
MSYNRTSGTLRGAAVLQISAGDGIVIRTPADLKTTLGYSTFDVPYGENGKQDPRMKSVDLSVTCQPVCQVTQAILDFLFSPLTKRRGESLLGATDITCAIVPKAGGEAITLKSVYVAKMPKIQIRSTATSLGEFTLRGVLPNSTNWAAAEARFAYAAAASAPELDEVDPATILTSAAQIAWGASPFAAVKTGEGVEIDWDMKTIDDEVDDDGIIDVWLDGLVPKVKITSPRSITIKNLLDRMALMQGEGSGRGKRVNATVFDLTAQGADVGSLKVTVPKCALQSLPITQGAMTKWINAIDLVGTEEDDDPATVELVPEPEA